MILWQKMQTEERQNTKSLRESWIYLQKIFGKDSVQVQRFF